MRVNALVLEVHTILKLHFTGPALAVGNVDPDGPMHAAGLQKGDRIMSVNGVEIHEMSRSDAAAALKGALESSPTKVLKLVVGRRCRPDVRVTAPHNTTLHHTALHLYHEPSNLLETLFVSRHIRTTVSEFIYLLLCSMRL